MSKTAIFAECNIPYLVDVAAKLTQDHEWRIAYWIGSRKLEAKIRSALPGVIFHSRSEARLGIPPLECKNLKLIPPGRDTLESLSTSESMVYRMMEGFGLPFRDRVRLYHRLVRYWLTILNQTGADLVVFPVSPHGLYNYVLYLLCKARGVRTIVFEYTALPDVVFPVEHFEVGSKELESVYKGLISRPEGHSSELSEAAREILSVLGQSQSRGMSGIHNHKMKEVKAKAPGSKRVRHFVQWGVSLTRLAGVRLRMLVVEILSALLNRNLKPEQARLNDRVNVFQNHRFLLLRWKKARLRDYYQSRASAASTEAPFIFFALHSQPERTTKPNGGVFVDQFLAVHILSRSLPEGWWIYVKEHPGQFVLKNADVARSMDYYDEMVLLPNVKMISLSVRSSDLIEKARAVATISGTAGWEAIMKGKPALLFGNPWYVCCEGSFLIGTLDESRKALSRIVEGYEVDRKKVDLFVEAVLRVGCRGYVTHAHRKITKLSYEENVLSITEAIERFYAEMSAGGSAGPSF